MKQSIFGILGINARNISQISKDLNIPIDNLNYYEKERKLPIGSDLHKIANYLNISTSLLKIKLGFIDFDLCNILQNHEIDLENILEDNKQPEIENLISPSFSTNYGKLYQSDCISFLKTVPDNTYDLIFADPPFNLNKLYPSKINDSLKDEEYLMWQEKWVFECIRTLKIGGSLFLWNLPKWNTYITSVLNSFLTFKHWISVDIKYSLPIQGRLYPSHYSLLYYVKGKRANTFHPDRLPMEICPNCQTDLRDYGGYKNKMNPLGVNLSDIWYDIPPVRHSKYKKRKGSNELSIKLLDRIIEMSTDEGDIVFDPFGGSGTTYVVSELKRRKWVGTEIGPLNDIVNRFMQIEEERKYLENIRDNLNCLFTKTNLNKRIKLGLWTPESVRKNTNLSNELF